MERIDLRVVSSRCMWLRKMWGFGSPFRKPSSLVKIILLSTLHGPIIRCGGKWIRNHPLKVEHSVIIQLSEGLPGGSLFPCSLPKLPYVPMFPYIFRMFSYCNFSNFKNSLMFPCSHRYFANVPLFPKTPGRPSLVAG